MERMETKKKFKLEYAFYSLMGVFIVLFLYGLFNDEKGTQLNIFFHRTNDFLADYINVERYSAYKNPYFDPLNGMAEKGYLPICYLLFYYLGRPVKFGEVMQEKMDPGYWNLNLAIASYVMFLMTAVMFIQLFRMKKGSALWKYLSVLVLSFSGVAIFSYERGNMIYIAVIGVIFFIQCYRSENKALREASFIALAVAAAFKGYPALLGVLLLMEKRWFESARLLAYGLIVGLGPFKLVEGGFRYNLSQWMDNVSANSERYRYMSNPRFGYLYFLSQMKGGDTRDFWDGVLKIVFYVLIFIGIVAVTQQKIQWKKMGMLMSAIILLPVNSAFYCGLYLFPVVILFLDEEERNWLDLLYLLALAVILNPFQWFTKKGYNISLAASNIAMFTFAGLLVIDNCVNFGRMIYRKRKIVETA